MSGPTFYEVVARMAASFRRTRPQIRLEITAPLFGRELVELVTQGKIDAALVRMPVQAPGLAVRRIMELLMVAVLPPGHRLRNLREVAQPQYFGLVATSRWAATSTT